MKNLLKLIPAGVFLLILFSPFTFADLSAYNNFREVSPREHHLVLKNEKASLHFRESRVKLDIDDAVLSDTDISCVETDFSYHASDFQRHSPIYNFGPHGLKFTKDVLLTLSYDDSPALNEQALGIYYFNPSNGQWEKMPVVTIDTTARTITCKISHFSIYAAGSSSYRVTDASAVSNYFFSNFNERTDPATGCMSIDHTMLHVPGRGIDLSIAASFSSSCFFSNYPTSPYTSILEEDEIYRFSEGWRFKLPALRYETIYTYDAPTDRIFYLYTPEGKRYRLPLSAVKDKPINEVCTVDGCRIWKTNTIVDGYHLSLELIEEQLFLGTDILDPGTASARINPTVRFGYGSVCYFYSATGGHSYSGNVRYIYDTAIKNCLTFAYNTDGTIATIADTLGKTAVFTYSSGILTKISYDGIARAMFTINSSYWLTAFKQLADITDGVSRYTTTGYTYNTTDKKVKITYPTGGSSEYLFGHVYDSYETQIISIYQGSVTVVTFRYHPAVTSRIVRASSTDIGTTTTFTYLW